MITIPINLWEQALFQFSKEKRKVEQVCYFDGVSVGGDKNECIVTTLTIPLARLEPGRFEVPAEAMSQAGKHFRKYRMRRLAQIHTHPTDWVGHSEWDDNHAYSLLPGSISIVLPWYAKNNPQLTDAGVHLRTKTGWKQLSPDEVGDYIRIIPSLLDFRPVPERHYEREHIKPPRRRSWWSAFAFWRNQ